MSAKARRSAAGSKQDLKEEELLRNVTTTTDKQPPNKFISNTEKVSEKPVSEKTASPALSSERESLKEDPSKLLKKTLEGKNMLQLKEQNINIDSKKMASSTSRQLHNFSKKKQERDQEIIEIQEMLNQMKSPQKCTDRSSKDSEKDAKEGVSSEEATDEADVKEKSIEEKNDVPFYGRCKTELNLITKPMETENFRVARIDTARKCSSTPTHHKPRSKSANWPLSSNEIKSNKKLNYNQEEARRYMEMQKKQRKLYSYKNPAIKSKIEKEEIKKRLEELKNNTRKLIIKNIQKKEKCMGKSETNDDEGNKIMPHDTNLTQQEQNKESLNRKESSAELENIKFHSRNSVTQHSMAEQISQKSLSKLREQNKDSDPARYETDISAELQVIKYQARVSSGNSLSNKEKVSHRTSKTLTNILKPAGTSFPGNYTRIGLLRKTENDTGHRSYNSDKENRNLERLTTKLILTQENNINDQKNNAQSKEFEASPSARGHKETDVREYIVDLDKDKQKRGFEVTTTNLKSGNGKAKENCPSSQSLQNETPKPNGLRYWLKPSATQVYPYNFIVAVRRKLEAIAQPTAAHTSYDTKRNQETSTADLISELKQRKRKAFESRDDKDTKKLKKQQENQENIIETSLTAPCAVKKKTPQQLKQAPLNMENNQYENKEREQESCNKNVAIHSDDESKLISQFEYLQKSVHSMDNHEIKHLHKTKSTTEMPALKPCEKVCEALSSDQEKYKQLPQQSKISTSYKSTESLNSEIISDISSISLPMPISNTLTEVSSLRTESRRTYTHCMKQSLIHSEDEVASLPSQLFGSPEKTLSKLQQDFDFIKPRAVSPLSLEKIDKFKIKSKQLDDKTENHDVQVDFTQLLDDFNRSLSQVIEVNEQLKCTLDKSQQILAPHSSKKSSDSDKQYSSDFEKSTTIISSSEENHKLEQHLQTSNRNLKQRKCQVTEIAEQVKPLSIEQRSENNSEDNIRPATTTPTPEEEQKILQSDFTDEGQTLSSIASQSYEKRLYEIENLKETLKQTILASKKKRKEKEQERENQTETENQADTKTKITSNSSEVPSEIETQNIENNTASENLSSKSDILKKYSSEHQTLKKYHKQYKNNEKYNTCHSENGFKSQTNSTKLTDSRVEYRNKHSMYNSNKVLQSKYNNSLVEKPHERTEYSASHSNSNSIVRHQKKINDGVTEDIESEDNDAQSESTNTQTRKCVKSKSISESNEVETAKSSSIAEELQKTYESKLYDNENIPPNSKTKAQISKYVHEHNSDAMQFIKGHINCSRGDFQENTSLAAQLNETEFQRAVEAASQISSGEFGQSADDEVTSSVASKPFVEIDSNPPSYKTEGTGRMSSKQLLSAYPSPKTNLHSSIGKEIVRFFNESDTEKSERYAANNGSVSESSLNYSNVGLYEKLIQNETTKSQHLTCLLKLREKALLDRTKGQIAWLEVQKARYKAKGLINHIATIKKRQRGILLKMEREREEIKRLLQTASASSKPTAIQTLPTVGHKAISQHYTPTKHKKDRLTSTTPPHTKREALSQNLSVKSPNTRRASPILRGTYELESSQALEELLKKREEDLKKRREHVERLIQWHKRLDKEEAEVLNLERRLLSYNNVPPNVVDQHPTKLPTTAVLMEKLTTAASAITTTTREHTNTSPIIPSPEKKRASRARKMEKRLKEIDKSLKELSHISASSTTSVVMGQANNEKEDSVTSVATQEFDFVRTTGSKLNKLWKRLTSQQIEKFEPTRRYKLCKSDLEHLYEEAKMAVLRDFAEDEERITKELLEKSASNLSSITANADQLNITAATADNKIIAVPMLNLNFSSGHSEAEEESANNSQHNATQQGNYSPSVAEENFKAQVLLNSTASSETTGEQQISIAEDKSSRMERNVQMFLALSQRIQVCGRQHQSAGRNLQRSLSDTEISDIPKYKADSSTASQKHIETVASHSNKNVTTNSSARSSDVSAQHQRSKSSIVEITYIPSTQTHYTGLSQTPIQHTGSLQGKPQTKREEDPENQTCQPNTRSSVLCSVGSVTPPIESCDHTSSDIATITGDSKSLPKFSRSSYSGQVGTNAEATAKEISSKLDEISAAVTQLSQMNALPSYESVTTHSHSKQKSINESVVNTNDESNLSTDASSYSFNFENITTEKHSSPGTISLNTISLNTISPPQKSSSTKTHTTEEVSEHYEAKQYSSTTPVHTTDPSTSLNSTKSKTFVKDDAKTSSQTQTQSMLENRILDAYEADFESDLSSVTHIEDISIPVFDITAETTQDDNDEDVELFSSKSLSTAENSSQEHQAEKSATKVADKTYNVDELIKSVSSSDSDKSPTNTDCKFRIHSPDRELLPPPPPLPQTPPSPSTFPSSAAIAVAAASCASISPPISNQVGSNHLMPDIINELELRRHQIILDNEHLKQYEHVTAVPYMYVREIPNKPPPPYVPPAHGSPMTTIFPSEDRIKDITFRRTHELYCELLKTDYCNEKGEKLPSVMEEQITNIYERIILDICREYLEEHAEILRDGDPINFHSQLAFFNPPNRLRCIQNAIYKEVRAGLAMDKTQPKRTQIYSVYGQRAKQDHIGKIIIQEMYDEDDRWCNFHHEESEVLHLMVEEMINKHIVEISKEVFVEDGGTIDEAKGELSQAELTITEENAANHQAKEVSQFDECLDEKKRHQQSQLQTSSALVETINEGDQTYCINESKQEEVYAVVESDLQENVNSTNITTSTNALQTCT